MTVFEVYDPAEDAWTSGASLPAPLGAYAIAAVGDQLYIFGGWDGARYVASTYAYDSRRDAWEERHPMPTARGFAAAGAIGGRIYVVGGYDNRQEYATCEVYDPQADAWSSCAPMTEARGGIGAGVIQDRLYVVGGGWAGYLSYNERYDPATDTWGRFETPLTLQWRNLGVAALEGDLFAAGGWSGEPLGVVQTYQAVFKLFLPATTGK
jgi:N-acetylneuraminic acid mutarotase